MCQLVSYEITGRQDDFQLEILWRLDGFHYNRL